MTVAVRNRTLSDAERRAGALVPPEWFGPTPVAGGRFRTVGGGPAGPVLVPGAGASAPVAAPGTPQVLRYGALEIPCREGVA